jgi:hypothetical protein
VFRSGQLSDDGPDDRRSAMRLPQHAVARLEDRGSITENGGKRIIVRERPVYRVATQSPGNVYPLSQDTPDLVISVIYTLDSGRVVLSPQDAGGLIQAAKGSSTTKAICIGLTGDLPRLQIGLTVTPKGCSATTIT